MQVYDLTNSELLHETPDLFITRLEVRFGAVVERTLESTKARVATSGEIHLASAPQKRLDSASRVQVASSGEPSTHSTSRGHGFEPVPPT